MALPDELGDLMRSHDHEAPRAADLPARPWARAGAPVVSRRRAVLLPLAAVAAVLVIVAGAVTLARVRTSGSTAAAPTRITSFGPPQRCPDRYRGLDDESTRPWVPAKPVGVDTGGRLVPDLTPSTVLVCGYSGGSPGNPSQPPQMLRSQVLTGNLDAVRESLTWLPPEQSGVGCAGVGLSTDDSAALLRLTYPGRGTVWVGVPGHDCATASNGLVATGDVYRSAAFALARGHWPAGAASSPKDDGQCAGTTGRFGQQTKLVPTGPTAAVICSIRVEPTRGGGSTFRTTKVTVAHSSVLANLVRRLDNLSAVPAVSHCSSGSLGTRRYEIRFDYADGPSVALTVDQGNACFGDISNGSLRSLSSASVLPLLNDLTR